MASELQLSRLFLDGEAFFKAYVAHLPNIYQMKHFVFCDSDIDEYQMQYCKKMYGFMIIFPYAVDLVEPCVFLSWAFSKQRLAWDAVASGIDHSYAEPRTNVENIFNRYLPSATMLTATPIASIENTFTRNGEIVRHIGLAYACATANAQKLQEENPDLKGIFIPTKDVPRLFLADSWNRDVILYASERISELMQRSRTADDEIVEQEKFHFRYLIHRELVKPLLKISDRVLSLLLHRVQRKNLQQIIWNAIPYGVNYLIDVSAGDNTASIQFGEKCEVVVLNDVSWSTLNFLVNEVASSKKIKSDIVFTNEDLLCAPFKDQAFDVIFCRNTLHHMSTVNEVRTVITYLQRWAKRQVIIADVIDPRENPTIWDWFRDQYYRRFLKDVGNALLPYAQLSTLLQSVFSEDEWQYKLELYNTVGGKIVLFIAYRQEP